MQPDRKPVRLFTIVWGTPYLNWFENACAKSLCWPRNREALQRVEACDLWITPEDSTEVSRIAGRLGISLVMHADLDAKTLKPNLIGSLIRQMDLCIARGAAFIWAFPDSIFGDGSIASLLEIGAPARVCVAAAPLRVLDTILCELDSPRDNSALVRLGFEHMHPLFREAMIGTSTNSFTTGISWREIRKGLYALQYRAYNAWLMTPEKKDADWFRKNSKFGYYDSRFPESLVQEQR